MNPVVALDVYDAAGRGRLHEIPIGVMSRSVMLHATMDGRTALHKAAANGQLRHVPPELLGDLEALATCDLEGVSVLHLAARTMQLHLVAEAIRGDRRVMLMHERSEFGRGATVLHEAASSGALKQVPDRLLHDQDALLWPDKDGAATPLHDAIRAGFIDQVPKDILGSRSAMLTSDLGGETPLHWAARKGHLSAVPAEVLGDVEAMLTPDRWGVTPVGLAYEHGFLNQVPEVLRDYAQMRVCRDEPLRVRCHGAKGAMLIEDVNVEVPVGYMTPTSATRRAR